MQQFKQTFLDESIIGTVSNVQSCLRLNDLEEIDDGQHLLYFNMLGLFSFREMTLQESVDFWMEFLNEIGVQLSYVTIHPDKPEWKELYSQYSIEIKEDEECVWSDGNISGYCTEFYVGDLEIGNIVNPLGTCIDVGFGLERLQMVLGMTPATSKEILKSTILKLIDSGYYPSNKRQGYVLRKLIRRLIVQGQSIDHQFYEQEYLKIEKSKQRYHKLKRKHSDKSPEWWYDTHGIDVSTIDE
jgi:alanyl-tRNA synthetase